MKNRIYLVALVLTSFVSLFVSCEISNPLGSNGSTTSSTSSTVIQLGSIVFEANDNLATGSMLPMSGTIGEEIMLSVNGFSHPDKVFSGWSLTTD